MHLEPKRDVVVIGVGNPSRRDDGAGIAFIRDLRSRLGDGSSVALFESDGDPAQLLEYWTGVPEAIVVDASSRGVEPGTVTEFSASHLGSNGNGLRHSTHAMGVMEAVALGTTLGRMPSRLRIIGVEGCDFSFGEGLNPAVRAAVANLVEQIAEEVLAEKSES